MSRLMTRTHRQKKTCGYCGGDGTYEAEEGTVITSIRPCPVCKEHRVVRVPGDSVKCPECCGTGKNDTGEFVAHKARCKRCEGTGWAPPPPAHR
jgi:DnaJ-class molecular chaperone